MYLPLHLGLAEIDHLEPARLRLNSHGARDSAVWVALASSVASCKAMFMSEAPALRVLSAVLASVCAAVRLL